MQLSPSRQGKLLEVEQVKYRSLEDAARQAILDSQAKAQFHQAVAQSAHDSAAAALAAEKQRSEAAVAAEQQRNAAAL